MQFPVGSYCGHDSIRTTKYQPRCHSHAPSHTSGETRSTLDSVAFRSSRALSKSTSQVSCRLSLRACSCTTQPRRKRLGRRESIRSASQRRSVSSTRTFGRPIRRLQQDFLVCYWGTDTQKHTVVRRASRVFASSMEGHWMRLQQTQ